MDGISIVYLWRGSRAWGFKLSAFRSRPTFSQNQFLRDLCASIPLKSTVYTCL